MTTQVRAAATDASDILHEAVAGFSGRGLVLIREWAIGSHLSFGWLPGASQVTPIGSPVWCTATITTV